MSTRERLFGPIADSHLWCLHCERTYQKASFRLDDDGRELCAYKDCDGDAVVDAWAWSRVRQEREDRYPEVPESGVVYPLND